VRGCPAQPINAAHQFMLLRANALSAGQGVLGSGEFTWRFEARPSPLSRKYQLRIEFKQGDRPFVFVDGPDLIDLADGRRLPHVYEQRPTRLCLYFPKTGEWRSHMRIDQTIVPWAVLWLFYFEEWLWSDDWKGGGIHPEVGSALRERNRRPQTHAA
jgi:hypothetical protein